MQIRGASRIMWKIHQKFYPCPEENVFITRKIIVNFFMHIVIDFDTTISRVVNAGQILIHHNLFITLLLGSKPTSVHVSYPNRVISRVKCIGYIGKGVLNSHLILNMFSC